MYLTVDCKYSLFVSSMAGSYICLKNIPKISIIKCDMLGVRIHVCVWIM